jgi:hypothetical protein
MRIIVVFGFILALLAPGAASAQGVDDRSFPSTGFSVDDDAIWSYYTQRGGQATFGAPISREFSLGDTPTQIFEISALQVQPDGSVSVVPLASAGYLPFTHFDGLTVPAPDGALAMLTPTSDQTNYVARLAEFVRATVPDSWGGQPVAFGSMASNALDVWGMPLSSPAADPRNPAFVYQRFANGILMYDATSGTTGALALGTYFKELLTGSMLPSDLATDAASSPLFGQYAASDAFTPAA